MSTYANFAVKDRDKLKKYVKMKLGWPILTVEVTDEQLDFVIDEAVEVYSKWVCYDDEYYALDFKKVTEISKDNPAGSYDPKRGFKLPEEIVGVSRIHEASSALFSNTGNSMDFLLSNSGMYPTNPFGGSNINSMYSGGMFLSVYMWQNYCKMWQEPMGYNWVFNYNERTKFLKLTPDPMVKKVGASAVVIECKVVRSEDQLFGEDIVKRLAVALTKQLVGQVRAKFGSGIAFPGGGQIGSEILSEGKEEYDKIIEELQKTQPPYMFFLQK